ncbi:MAG: hypothetical protein AB4080_18865 [Trichodesmium sp.]
MTNTNTQNSSFSDVVQTRLIRLDKNFALNPQTEVLKVRYCVI